MGTVAGSLSRYRRQISSLFSLLLVFKLLNYSGVSIAVIAKNQQISDNNSKLYDRAVNGNDVYKQKIGLENNKPWTTNLREKITHQSSHVNDRYQRHLQDSLSPVNSSSTPVTSAPTQSTVEPTLKPTSEITMKPTSFPTSAAHTTSPTLDPSPYPTLFPILGPSSQPTFTYLSTITGYYNWKLKGSCCDKKEEASPEDVIIITEIIRVKARFYSKKESGDDSGIEVVVGDDIVQTVTISPLLISFNLKVTFNSRSIDVKSKVKNLAKDDNYARGFHQWFNNSTQQAAVIYAINENYPNEKGAHFEAADGSPFDLVRSGTEIPTPSTTSSAPTPTDISSTLPTIDSSGIKPGVIVGIVVVVVIFFALLILRLLYQRELVFKGRFSEGFAGGFDQNFSRPSSLPNPQQPINSSTQQQQQTLVGYPYEDPIVEEKWDIGPNDQPSCCPQSIDNENLQQSVYSSSGSGSNSDSECSEEFRDDDMEKVRNDVAASFEDGDVMVSEALVRAWITDDENSFYSEGNEEEGKKKLDMVKEANALCDTQIWLKRHEQASLEDKKEFMQRTLNRLVTDVRYKVITPETASRTVHECAALLELKLKRELPETSILVSGMRKTCKKEDLVKVFMRLKVGDIKLKESDIEDAEVITERGFGVIRFHESESVRKVMDVYRKEDIVVNDVDVVVKVLKSTTHSTNNGSNIKIGVSLPASTFEKKVNADIIQQNSSDDSHDGEMQVNPESFSIASGTPGYSQSSYIGNDNNKVLL